MLLLYMPPWRIGSEQFSLNPDFGSVCLKIAILDAWPNLAATAEREFIARFVLACEHVGIGCKPCVTSDEIETYAPDAVVASHEFSRKLTRFPMIGIVWSPLSFFMKDPYRMASIRSFDGYLAGNMRLRKFLSDMQIGMGREKPVAPGSFLPTACQSDLDALATASDPKIFYAGVHWDGARHADLLAACARRGIMRLHGPAERWQDFGEAYKGALPFDGKSVQAAIAEAGLALCLHRPEHRQDNLPSMRLFEALSVGALPICDDMGFARDHLSDVAFFVDPTLSPAAFVDALESILDWVRVHPREAYERAQRGKQWFERHWSLEQLIQRMLVPLVAALQPEQSPQEPELVVACEVILPLAGADASVIRQSLHSLAAASRPAFPLGLVLLGDAQDMMATRGLLAEAARLLPTRHLQAIGPDGEVPSLHDALAAVQAEHAAFLSPGDRVTPDHFRHLSEALARAPLTVVATSEAIEDLGQECDAPPNFAGPLGLKVAEHRRLRSSLLLEEGAFAASGSAMMPGTWMIRMAPLRAVLEEIRFSDVADPHEQLRQLVRPLGFRVFSGRATLLFQEKAGQERPFTSSVV